MKQTTRYQKFKKALETGLDHSSMNIHEIYKTIKDSYPRDCDDNEPCIHKGHFYQDGEWRHEVRNVLQGLKKDGLVKYNAIKHVWMWK